MDTEYITQGLLDSGLSEDEIRLFLSDEKKRGPILTAQRRKLIEELHSVQKRIDTLDYLTASKVF